jgi:hypothetical protein
MTSRARVSTLENRLIHGPVLILIGGRVRPERPSPPRFRRYDA